MDIVLAPLDQSIRIVAGPGSGKTTVMVLRVIKLILVDGADPRQIMVTTFTKKAAAELRSRILGWADLMVRQLVARDPVAYAWLYDVNFNAIRTGTIDSIAEEILTETKQFGMPTPTVIDEITETAIMTKRGLRDTDLYLNKDLTDLIKNIVEENRDLINMRKSSTICDIRERCIHYGVNPNDLRLQYTNDAAIDALVQAINSYDASLRQRFIVDFVGLETELLNALSAQRTEDFRTNLKFILIDEYQDTNFLQERIYFLLARAAVRNGGSITIVGDDDQSIYRFRGGIVALFRDFNSRIQRMEQILVTTRYLFQSYRATQDVIDFCNDFIELDQTYQGTRVPGKPKVSRAPDSTIDQRYAAPILGMFRSDATLLARDLARAIDQLVNGQGFTYSYQGQPETITMSQQASTGDIVLLSHKPSEFAAYNNNSGQRRPRLPGLLREELSRLQNPIQVFNPRGQDLRDIGPIRVLCGTLLECLDPNKTIQQAMFLDRRTNRIYLAYQEPNDYFDQWRNEAQNYAQRQTSPQNQRVAMATFINNWQSRTENENAMNGEASSIALIKNIVTWIPMFQDDVEGVVYLEALIRAAAQVMLDSPFGGNILVGDQVFEQPSIRAFLEYVLLPLAVGSMRINEDLLETIPPNRVSIMSVHQAKGLEFPLVIVDVGSDFKGNHVAQRRFRYPDKPGPTSNIEDLIGNLIPRALRNPRGSIDRALDDLIREYYVAFSRSKSVLILVGTESVRDCVTAGGKSTDLYNVATGWVRDPATGAASWIWRPGLNNLVRI